jgi:hypothetical protein
MKKVMERGWMMILAFVMVTALGLTTTEAQSRVSLQVFYDELQPYGTWMDYGSHGYVWVPRVERGFVPYATNGYWINTAQGNAWVSDYSWGWAPFHYGRWLFDDFYGWIWVPDTEWAPAWVAWRSGGGYYGWAPLMPGMGIHASFHFYNGFPAHYWSFVPYRYVTYRQVYNHCVPRPQVVNIINHTTIITHNHVDHRRNRYFTGPTRNEIEHRGGGRVTVHTLSERDRPGRTEVSRSSATFYRPEVENSRESRSRAVPSSFVKRDNKGNFEKVEPAQRGRDDVFSYRRSKADEKNSPAPENRNRFDPRNENDPNGGQNMRRSTYQSEQRFRTFQKENPSRTYERIPLEKKNNVRDRYEAPNLERSPANRETQRPSSQPTRQWRQGESQAPSRQRSVQPNYERKSSTSFNRTRSSMNQSQQPAQMQKRQSGTVNRTPSRAMDGHSVYRKRN